LAILLLIYFFLKVPREDSVSLIAIALLFGGALGNLIDRIRFGEVIDFLDFYIGSYHWPAFNVADSAITVGISLLVLDAFIKRQIQTDPPRGPFVQERFKGNG
jgi:signal peptidase II